MNIHEFRVTSFEDAATQLGNRNTLKLCRNTYLERPNSGSDWIFVRYYDTEIVCHYRDGSVYLNSGKWRTSTTKQRINRCLPEGFHVFKKRGVWWVRCGQFPTTDVMFKDGMELIG